MKLNDQDVTTPPRAAATVVLLRDAAEGMEVFMVERHGLSDVLGGAYVFPGGKLDPADADPQSLRRIGAPVDDLHAALCEPELDAAAAAGFYVAACRETFEEAGVLLAAGAGAREAAAAQEHAHAGLGFGDMLARLGLRPDWDRLVPWSRWVTPRVPALFNKRFDARFFLALAPDGQQARHDNHEATGSFWLRPRVVLERYWAGEIQLAPAQIMSMATLARFSHAADAIAAARARRPPLIQPEPFTHRQLRAVAFPGNERHALTERALAGPTFLVYRNGRFEPFDGLEALIA